MMWETSKFNFLYWLDNPLFAIYARVDICFEHVLDVWIFVLQQVQLSFCLKSEMAKNIIDAIAPLSAISKFCGYSIFTINQLDFSIEFKRNDWLFYIWIVLLNCFLNTFLWDQHRPLHRSDILSKSLPAVLGISYGFYVFTMISSLATRKKQSILIQSIYEIDEMVRNLVFNEISFHYVFNSFRSLESRSTMRSNGLSLSS